MTRHSPKNKNRRAQTQSVQSAKEKETRKTTTEKYQKETTTRREQLQTAKKKERDTHTQKDGDQKKDAKSRQRAPKPENTKVNQK